ncbi:class I SAM-dependent methyltransferase [Pseudomonadota bacterium]
MRSKHLELDQYDTDKITSGYLDIYDPILESWLDKDVNLLELGVHKGGSLLLWRDYFSRGKIVGVDKELPKDFEANERIRIYEGSQDDKEFLTHVANETAPDGFDIIIDDASHMGSLTKTSFWHLFDNHLKPNGLYVIEDWGTGYWSDWHDGKSLDLESYLKPHFRINQFWLKVAGKFLLKAPMPCHSYGMVGFVKQLIDEQAAHDVTKGGAKGKAKRESRFENINIFPALVFIKKAGNQLEYS